MDRFEETRDRIKDAIDLIGLVEGYVPLRRRGRTMVGLCPFHDEKTASFTVWGDTQHFHCFGCGKTGDVFTFVKEREGLEFREAFEWLAERAGISTEGVFGQGRRSAPKRPRVDVALGVVRDWFRQQLQTPAGAAAREYLEARGLDDAIETFGLGYHPDPKLDARSGGGGGDGSATLLAFSRERKIGGQLLADAGLLKRSSSGDVFEPFRGRLIFPIEDDLGRVVGFGGRILPHGDVEGRDGFKPPKYLNSPESPFFNKRRVLFGLRHVKAAGQRRVVVMEGYTDVIACHLAGITGAVATLGTALTTDHAKLLRRWADEGVVLMFDGDRAGRQAAEKAYRELAPTDLDLRIALAPDGQDPADMVLARPGMDAATVATGREAMGDLIARADDALTVWFRLLRARMDLSQPVHVERAAEECARVLASLDSAVRRQSTQNKMASYLGVGPDALSGLARAAAARLQQRSDAAARRQQNSAASAGAGAAAGTVPSSAAGEDPEWAATMASAAGFVEGDGSDGHEVPVLPDVGAPIEPSRAPTPLAAADSDIVAGVLAEPSLLPLLEGVSFRDPSHLELVDLLNRGVDKGLKSREALVRFAFGEAGEKPELARILARCAERSSRIKDPADFLSSLIQGRSTYVAKATAQDYRRQAQQALAAGDREEADRFTRLYVEATRAAAGAHDGVGSKSTNSPKDLSKPTDRPTSGSDPTSDGAHESAD